MKYYRIFTLAIIVIVTITPLTVRAVGIQVSPSKLDVQQTHNSGEAELVVANPTADVLLFEIYPDDFEKEIKANPSSFTLEAGGRKTVKVITRFEKENTFVTNISVVSHALAENKLQTNTGVKIPVTVTASNEPTKNNTLLVIAGLLGAALVAKLLYEHRTKKKNTLS